MKINILIPYKEQFDEQKLSSVAITILNNFNHSKFKKNIRIFGRKVKNPAKVNNFIPINNSINFLKSKNIHLAEQMCNQINKDNDPKQLIEIHNRPVLFHYVIKKLKINLPVTIFFHNNPLEMSGSKTILERKKILENAREILCVSEYIKKKFLTGINYNPANVSVLYNGVDRNLKNFPLKKKEVLFVGRLVEEKGIKLFIKVVENIAAKLPFWKFCIVGSSQLGLSNEKSNFAKNCRQKFLNIGSQAYFSGYLNNKEVQNKMKEASIVVVPSLWEEPYGLVVAEAMSNGAAVITTSSGGIPEIIGSNGIIIKNINTKKLEDALFSMMKSEKKLEKYQKLSWKNFKHYASKSSKQLDQIRTRILN